jgi:hypothetical protein
MVGGGGVGLRGVVICHAEVDQVGRTDDDGAAEAVIELTVVRVRATTAVDSVGSAIV